MKYDGDKIFLFLTFLIVILGLLIFFSASLGLLSRVGEEPLRLIATQIGFGLIPGLVAIFFLRKLKPALLEKYAPYIYFAALLFTGLVFFPGIGTTLNGATRWIDIFGITTVQPAEFLKVATILMVAFILSRVHNSLSSFWNGLVPFLFVVALPVLLLILQPNTSTALILSVTSLVLYAISGAPIKYTLSIIGMGILMLLLLVFLRPYLMDRVLTYIDPARDPLDKGYQIQQSLIAIGSGEFTGRGFGQSVQKFNYLPEPVGDSVFAVYAEEFGFIGATILVFLFLLFSLQGIKIAGLSPTRFTALAVTGLVLMIIFSAFFNIGAMLGIVPLSGLPLPFVSHGGSAFFASLIAVGIILSVGRHSKTKSVS